MTAATRAARRLADDALAVLYPEQWTRLYLAAVKAQETGLDRACACGQVMRRVSLTARWPKRCDRCKGAAS